MTFAWPHLLWLLLLPVGLLAWEITRRRRSADQSAHPKILRAEIAAHEIAVVRAPEKAATARVRPWLALGLAFTIVALARPQWGRIEEPVFDQSREILLAIDLSRSMLSPDVKPSRLERAKLLVQSLLEKLKGERVGLVVFSGTAFLQSPLSSDYEILREFLPALNPDFLPEGGTNYRALIDTAIDAFGTSNAADRFLIVLSDGEATDDDWKSKVDDLKKKGVRVIGLGVGTIAGTMIPDGSGGFVKDQRGAVVLSKLESATLEELAAETHGTYRDASTWIDLASLIDQTVNEGKKGAFVDKNTIRYVERFQWPLAFALWCFLVSFFYEFPVQPRARDISLRSGEGGKNRGATAGAKAAALLLLLGATTFALLPAPAHAAVNAPLAPQSTGADSTPAAPGDPATLIRIVGRLSQQNSLSSPDLSEFAHETLNWGRRIKDTGKPVPAGPVNDALRAVDELEAKGDRLADWSQLRKDLEALLQQPPEQKQQQQQKNQPQKQNQDQKQDKQKQQDQKQSQQQQDKNQSGSPENKNDSTPKNQPEKSDQSQNESTKNQPSGQQPEQKPDQPLAFGDMNKQPQPPPPPPGETQKVGGAPEQKQAKEPQDPALALPMQKLDQLKNEDSPGKLFQLMQSDRSQASQKKPAKDW